MRARECTTEDGIVKWLAQAVVESSHLFLVGGVTCINNEVSLSNGGATMAQPPPPGLYALVKTPMREIPDAHQHTFDSPSTMGDAGGIPGLM